MRRYTSGPSVSTSSTTTEVPAESLSEVRCPRHVRTLELSLRLPPLFVLRLLFVSWTTFSGSSESLSQAVFSYRSELHQALESCLFQQPSDKTLLCAYCPLKCSHCSLRKKYAILFSKLGISAKSVTFPN